MIAKTWKYWTISVWHINWEGDPSWHFFGSSASRNFMLAMLETVPNKMPIRIDFNTPNNDDLSTLIYGGKD